MDTDEQVGSGGFDSAVLLERTRRGDLRLLSRAISLVENQAEPAPEILKKCAAAGRKAIRIGVTGPPGAGKSTLVDQMVRSLRTEGKTVAVLAVDPSSPYSGGALLGDRIRMQGFAGDPGVYIRSVASRGALGGLTASAEKVCAVLDAAGFDVLVVETIGAGQEAIAIAEVVDVTLLVLLPGMGDDVQSLKAGVMEIADVFAVNKADRGGAEQVRAEVQAMQGLSPQSDAWVAPVVLTSALSGAGVAELLGAIWQCRETRSRAIPRAVPMPVSVAGATMDHLGIAVRSLAMSRRFYETLGLRVAHEETVEHEQVHTAMLPVGESRIELLEPTTEDSVLGRFLKKRGEGLHHVALRVTGVDAMFARLQAEGVRLASDAVRVGAGGHRYFFVHPSSTGGVLLEIVGDPEGAA